MIGGSFFEPNLEDIAAAQPDLVFGLGGVHDGLRERAAAHRSAIHREPRDL